VNKYYHHNTAFPSMSMVTVNNYLRLAGMNIRQNWTLGSTTAWEDFQTWHFFFSI